MSEFDIIMTTHNHLDITIKAIECLYKYTDTPFELTIVDDSEDLTPQWATQFAKENENFHYVRPTEFIRSSQHAWNIGLEHTTLPFVVCMVNSVAVEPHWFESAFELMKRQPKAGIVGFKILNTWGTIQCTAITGVDPYGIMSVVGKDEPGHSHTYVSKTGAVGGAIWLARRKAIDSLDKFEDTIYIGFRGFDDLDTCLAMREKGWDVYYCGYGAVYHVDSPTKKQNANFWEEFELNKQKFMQRWHFVKDQVKRKSEAAP